MKNTIGPMAKREAKLAYTMLLPTVLIVFMIVILPLTATFWISVKPVTLADLRPPEPIATARSKGKLEQSGDTATLEFRLRNSSVKKPASFLTNNCSIKLQENQETHYVHDILIFGSVHDPQNHLCLTSMAPRVSK